MNSFNKLSKSKTEKTNFVLYFLNNCYMFASKH